MGAGLAHNDPDFMLLAIIDKRDEAILEGVSIEEYFFYTKRDVIQVFDLDVILAIPPSIADFETRPPRGDAGVNAQGRPLPL
jgi:hypothetical protein